MNLLAGLLSLALIAIIVRCAVLPKFIRLCTLGSGVALYFGLHLSITLRAMTGDEFGIIWGESRLGLILAASILLGVLVRFAMLPFLGAGTLPRFDARGFSLPTPAVHVGVWITGSVLVRALFLRPALFSGGMLHLTRTDLPLLFFCSTVLLALVLWKFKEEYGAKPHAGVSSTARDERRTEQPASEEKVLQGRIEKLQREVADAERRWAIATLQERAARICAERLAQEFAEARKPKESPQETLRPLSVREAFAVFDLSPGCGADSLRDSYHRLILQNHPDKVATLGPQLRAVAERETKNINAAYSLAMRHALVASPTSVTSRTPFHATGGYPRASGPNDSRRENTGTLMGRPDAVTR